MSGIELRHLQALVALTEEGTFTDAAVRLGVTQSAVSRTIAAFERVVGAALVRRTTRSVALTPAGTRAYHAAVRALAAVDDVAAAAADRARPLRLGYSWSALGRHTSTVLRRWRAEHRDVPLEIRRVDDRDSGLGRGVADIGVIRGAVELPGVASALLVREPRVAAVPAGHRLARRASVTLDDLRAETVLTTAYGTTTADLWPDEPRPAVSFVDNTDEWLTEIAGGVVVGVTAGGTAEQHPHPGVAYVPLAGVDPIAVHLAWPRRHPHPATGAFVAFVAGVVSEAQSVAQELSGPGAAGAGAG